MNTLKKMITTLAVSLLSSSVFAANHDPEAIIALMPKSKINLLSGIEHAEATSGIAISAKYEIDSDGKLVLSVYTLPEGLNVQPEKATFSELKYDPTVELPTPKTEIFPDKIHIARSAAQMTLFQQSKLSLKDVIKKAVIFAKGTPLDVRNILVINKRPVAAVILHNSNRGAYTVNVDLLNGRASFAQ